MMITPIRSSLVSSLLLIALALIIGTSVARAEDNQDPVWCVSSQIAAGARRAQQPANAGALPNPIFLPMVAARGNMPPIPAAGSILSQTPRIVRVIETLETGDTCVTLQVVNNAGHAIPRLSLEHLLKIDAGDAINLRAFSDSPQAISGQVSEAEGNRVCTFEITAGASLAPGSQVLLSCLYNETDDAVISSATTIHPRPFGGYDDDFNQIGDRLEEEGAIRQESGEPIPVLVLLDRIPDADDYASFEQIGGIVTYHSAQLPLFGGEIPPGGIGNYVAAAADHLEIIGDDLPLDEAPFKDEVPSPDTMVATVPNTGSTEPIGDNDYLALAIVDTGLDASHIALDGKIMGWYDVLDPKNQQASDTDGHGSLVAGIAAGHDDDFRGVAADTPLVGVRHGTAGNWRISNFVKALDWVIEHRQAERVVAINNSNVYTSGDAHHNPFWAAAATQAVEAGLIYVNAAGDGFADSVVGDTIGAPATEPKVITVGAINVDGNIANFSSRGASDAPDNAHTKPDVVAPGRNVRSTLSNQAAAAGEKNTYAVESGTSMAAPYVAGQATLLAANLSDPRNANQDADDSRDEDGWDGIDNDGDGLIDEDPAPWDYREASAAAIKSLILMVTAEAKGGERLPEASPNMNDVNDPRGRGHAPGDGWDRGDKDHIEGYGAVDISAAMDAVTREFCAYDTGSFSDDPGGQRVWARHLHLYAGKEYSIVLDGPEDADYDFFLYQGTPDPYGEPIIARRPGSQGAPIVATTKDSASESSSFQVRTDGLYYLVVRGVSGAGSFSVRLVTPETWTILLYMPAEQMGDDNLDSAAFAVLNELESIGSGQESTRDVQVLALIDYDVRNWQDDSQVQAADGANGDAVLYCIRKDHRSQVSQFSIPLRPGDLMDLSVDAQGGVRSEVNMGDPATLERFAAWGIDHFPATHYGLVLWGDGNGYGWKTNPDLALGPGNDTRSSAEEGLDSQADALDLAELRSAIEGVGVKIGQGSSYQSDTGVAAEIDLLGFDMGQMAQIEVATQVSDSVDVFVASQTNLTGHWPYAQLLSQLTCAAGANGWDCAGLEATDAESLAHSLVDSFAGPADGSPEQVLTALRLSGDETETDCATFAGLVGCVDELATTLADGVENGIGVPGDNQDNMQVVLSQRVRSELTTSTDRNFVDLRDLAEQLTKADIEAEYREHDQEIVDALTPGGPIVLAVGRSGGAEPAGSTDYHGLSIYFPEGQLWPETDCVPEPGAEANRCGYANPLPSMKLYASDSDLLLPSQRAQEHARPAQNQFRFVDETAWDEFLLRYYRPVATACLQREDNCALSMVAQIGETVTISGYGSSDIDNGSETQNVSAWIWDVNLEADHASGLPNYGEDADSIIDTPCTEDCDRDEIDEGDDDPDLTGGSISWTCEATGKYNMRLIVHDNHNQQPSSNGSREFNHYRHWNVDDDIFTINCFDSPYLAIKPENIITDQAFEATLAVRGHASLTVPAPGSVTLKVPPFVQLNADKIRCPYDNCSLDNENNSIAWTGDMVGDKDVHIHFGGIIDAMDIPEEAPYLWTQVHLSDGVIESDLDWLTPVIIKSATPLTVSLGSDIIYTTVIPADEQLIGAGSANFFDLFEDIDLLGQLEFDGSIAVPAGSSPPTRNALSGMIEWSGGIYADEFVTVKYALHVPSDLPPTYCGATIDASGQVNNGTIANGGLSTRVTIDCTPSE